MVLGPKDTLWCSLSPLSLFAATIKWWKESIKTKMSFIYLEITCTMTRNKIICQQLVWVHLVYWEPHKICQAHLTFVKGESLKLSLVHFELKCWQSGQTNNLILGRLRIFYIDPLKITPENRLMCYKLFSIHSESRYLHWVGTWLSVPELFIKLACNGCVLGSLIGHFFFSRSNAMWWGGALQI